MRDDSTQYEVPRVVQLIETEKQKGRCQRLGGKGLGSSMDTEFQFHKTKKFWTLVLVTAM